jgi:hypothetical protein
VTQARQAVAKATSEFAIEGKSSIFFILRANAMQLVKTQLTHPARVNTAHIQKHRKPLFHWPAAFIAKMTKGVNKPNKSGNFCG